jgi:hypothetical protein
MTVAVLLLCLKAERLPIAAFARLPGFDAGAAAKLIARRKAGI